MNGITLTMALLMGFTGSLHCAGMCGPIVWVLPFQAFSGFKKVLSLILYHTGRISIYATLALLLHSFRQLFHPQWQQYISITLGSILLLMGVFSFIPNIKLKLKLPFTIHIKKQLGYFLSNPGMFAMFMAGMLNGLLPCGLVYMALSASVAATNNFQAILFMYAFGLGTIPMLTAITISKGRISFIRFAHIRKLVPVVMFMFGTLFILRGLNLGIPYLSPKVAVTAHGIKQSCCHKPQK